MLWNKTSNIQIMIYTNINKGGNCYISAYYIFWDWILLEMVKFISVFVRKFET